jgi:hypothetical protein
LPRILASFFLLFFARQARTVQDHGRYLSECRSNIEYYKSRLSKVNVKRLQTLLQDYCSISDKT